MPAPDPAAGGVPGAVVAKAAAGMWPVLALVAAQVFVAGMLAFGGLTVVLTQLEDAFVDPGHLTSAQFADSYAESAFAPGPNGPIFLALLSMQAFGLVAVPVVVAAWAIPSLTITHQLGRLSQTTANAAIVRLLSVLKAAVVGLVLAGMVTLMRALDFSVPREVAIQGVLAVVGFVLIVRFKVNPLWDVGAGWGHGGRRVGVVSHGWVSGSVSQNGTASTFTSMACAASWWVTALHTPTGNSHADRRTDHTPRVSRRSRCAKFSATPSRPRRHGIGIA